MGYVETDSVQVGLFFTLMHRRHKKKRGQPELVWSISIIFQIIRNIFQIEL